MNQNDQEWREKLSLELGFKFDEAAELFSDETLTSMKMMNTIGGEKGSNYGICFGSCSINGWLWGCGSKPTEAPTEAPTVAPTPTPPIYIDGPIGTPDPNAPQLA